MPGSTSLLFQKSVSVVVFVKYCVLTHIIKTVVQIHTYLVTYSNKTEATSAW